MDQLERYNENCKNTCNQFVLQMNTLIGIFADEIEDACIKQLRQNWILVRRLLSNQDIVDQCGSYFLYFEKHILGDDYDYMLNYDFSNLVTSDTVESTRALIATLTDKIIATWKKGNEETNQAIVITTKRLVQYAALYKKFKVKIENLEI